MFFTLPYGESLLAKDKSKFKKIIAVIAQKGGVGKSTVTTQLAILLSTFGKRVLVVNSDTHQDSIGDALKNRQDKNIASITISTKNLRKELKNSSLLEGFDLALIDGEGSMHEHSKGALEVCDYFIIPILPSQFDINSYARYVSAVVEPTSEYKDLEGGVFINQDEYDASTAETLEILKEYPVPIFTNSLIRSKLIKKAAGLGMGIAEYRRNANATKSLFEFAKELFAAADIQINNFSLTEYIKRSQVKKNLQKGGTSDARVNKDKKTINNQKARNSASELNV